MRGRKEGSGFGLVLAKLIRRDGIICDLELEGEGGIRRWDERKRKRRTMKPQDLRNDSMDKIVSVLFHCRDVVG